MSLARPHIVLLSYLLDWVSWVFRFKLESEYVTKDVSGMLIENIWYPSILTISLNESLVVPWYIKPIDSLPSSVFACLWYDASDNHCGRF